MTINRTRALVRRLFVHCLGLVGFFALTACVADREPVKADFYVMRHLQEDTGSNPGLNLEGRFYAERLVYLFGTHRPRAIYVSTTRRAHETAAQVAAKWGLEPKDYDPSNMPDLITRILAEKGPVLVIGHGNTVPEIVERLSGHRPPSIAEADYADVWHIQRAKRRVIKYTIGNGDNLNDLP